MPAWWRLLMFASGTTCRPGGVTSGSPRVIVLTLLLLAIFAPSTSGSCLSYGHSCWGAHGKRNGLSSRPSLADGDATSGGARPSDAGGGPFEGRWYLSKVVAAPEPRDDDDLDSKRSSMVVNDNESGAGIGPWSSAGNDDEDEDSWQDTNEIRNDMVSSGAEPEILVMATEPRNRRPRKMRLYKLLKKRSSSHG